jgi:hypothetical protein
MRAAALIFLLAPALALAGPPDRDPAFWRALAERQFEPTGTVAELLPDTLALLSSTDPWLRDDIAYGALANWIYTKERLSGAELLALKEPLLARARAGLGEAEGDGVFGRSFATLALSLLAAEDLRRPFLDATAYQQLIAQAQDGLVSEQDLRGYVPVKGWAHATAHGADLLKFLARNPRLSAADANRSVEAIALRLASSDRVFVFGEDARLAAALAALAGREVCTPAAYSTWFAHLTAEHEEVWSGSFDPARYARFRAALNTLAQFSARLSESPPAPSCAALPGTIARLLTRLG